MKLLFVKPQSEDRLLSPPLGLMSISSALKERFPGVETRLLDIRLARRPVEAFSKLVSEWKPDFIGITAMTGDEPVIESLTEAAKRVCPGAHISCGGPYPTHVPDDFEKMRNVDSIVRGEGERAACSLIEALEGGGATRNPETLRALGISIRAADGSLATPGAAPAIADLDSLPFPDWRLVDIEEYSRRPQINGTLAGRRYAPIMSSRGCPFGCAYCHGMFGRKVRFRSPEKVMDEIRLLAWDYGVDEIQFIDDIFNVDRERAMKICDLIIESRLKIHISFPNGLRGDMLDPELISKFREAGAYQLNVAIETGSPRLQKYLNKNLDIQKTSEAVRYAKSLGMITKSFFMVGFPSETVEEIKQTFRTAVSLPLDAAVFFTVIPFPGTPLYGLAEEAGGARAVEFLKSYQYFYHSGKSYFEEATGENLQRLKTGAYLRFYTPWRLFGYIMKIPRKALYIRHLMRAVREAVAW